MKYEVIRDCIIKGNRCRVGDTVDDISQQLAQDLMAIGRIAPKDEEPAVVNRAIGAKDSEEKPKKRGRPAKPKAEPEAE